MRHKKGFASKARNKKRLSVGCFQEFVDARWSFAQSMCFMSVSLNATVLSYVVFFSAFLSVLEEWKPTKLIMQADSPSKWIGKATYGGLLDLSLFDAYGNAGERHLCPCSCLPTQERTGICNLFDRAVVGKKMTWRHAMIYLSSTPEISTVKFEICWRLGFSIP